MGAAAASPFFCRATRSARTPIHAALPGAAMAVRWLMREIERFKLPVRLSCASRCIAVDRVRQRARGSLHMGQPASSGTSLNVSKCGSYGDTPRQHLKRTRSKWLCAFELEFCRLAQSNTLNYVFHRTPQHTEG